MKNTSYKGVIISYSDRGEGIPLVLLHGYLESSEIWGDFAQILAVRHRLICVDLPGHGESGTWGEEHSMKDMAGALKAVLDAEGLKRALVVGHSMGGYVCMAFASLFPERLSGYVLLHSTCFADTEEKKLNRDREISLVQCGRKRQIIKVNIPRAFADSNLEKMKDEVRRAGEIACASSEEGMMALLRGMKERDDTSSVLSEPSLPLMLIGGMKDNYISPEVFNKLAAMAPHALVLRLDESGHMGFLEETEALAAALSEFTAACVE